MFDRKLYYKNWRKKHKQKIKISNKKHYENNKKERLSKCKIWRENNKEKLKIYFQKDYKINKHKRDISRKEWRMKNPEKLRSRKIENRYNITMEQYNKIFDKQHGRCAICNEHQSELKSALGVDHNHKNNIVRGLLCHRCNMAIGLLRESIELLNNAKKYLRR